MQLSDIANKVVKNALMSRYNSIINRKLPGSIDIKTYEFDGAMYHISNVDSIQYIRVSLKLNCYNDLQEHGVLQFLKKEYGPLLVATEAEYNVSLMLDISKVPVHYEKLVRRVSLLKRNCIASVLEKYLSFKGLSNDKLKQIYVYYRSNEVMYLEAKAGKSLITFSMIFKDYDEYLFAVIFLKEFGEGRRVHPNAPKMTLNDEDPPEELMQNLALEELENRLFLTIELTSDHTHPDVRSNSTDLIYYFRYYLNCQIIRTRIHLHSFMRTKTEYFLKEVRKTRQNPVDNKRSFQLAQQFRY